MVKIFKKLCFYIASFTAIALFLSAQSLYAAEKQSHTIPPKGKPMQNSSKAIHFFQEEMDFTTNPYAIKKAMDDKATNFVIIDVRSAKDYAEGHIPGAINIPYEKYNSFHGAEKEFPGLKKDAYNYIYCYELLCNLAKDAAIKFASLGYPVKEMTGGFNSWKDKGLPIEK